ncbi:MAG: hypothetical protein WAZ14_03085 [Patescibacteria group bacterium]
MSFFEAVRQVRISDYAVFDLAAAILGMALLAWPLSKLFLKLNLFIPVRSWVIWALPIGILAHLIVGTRTPMVTRFLDPNDNYLLKAIILTLTLLGFWGIKRVQVKRQTNRR